VLVVNPELPVHSVKELIALAKEKPGQLQYASAGVGSFQHLGGELFKYMAKVNLLHVPFKGGGPAMTDVVGGHTMVMFSSLVQTTPQIKAGRLRALGTGGLKRSPVLPDVPTVAEAGVPDYEAVNWWGIVAPAGTPPEIVARLHKAITEVQDSPEVQKQFSTEGAEVIKKSTDEFGAFMISEMNKWEHVVKEGGIKAE
jgi:tripartite-type tricarboxylate transporter receptor subunit TctC